MKHFLPLFALVCTVPCLLAAAVPEKTGVVAANILNVRNRPDAAAASVVAKLKRGETVRIVKQSGEWVEIAAPESASVYVFAQFFVDGKTTRDVNLRTGPGVEFQSYGIAPAGTELTAAGELKNGWQKVKPLSTMTCFASAKYIRVQEKPAEEKKAAAAAPETTSLPSPADAPQTAAVPTTPAVPAAAPMLVSEADMKQLHSMFEEGTAKEGEWVGKLVQVKKSALGALQYALIAPGNRLQPICHLAMQDLSACPGLVGHVVKVKGTMYPVANWKLPVVVAVAIAESSEK